MEWNWQGRLGRDGTTQNRRYDIYNMLSWPWSSVLLKSMVPFLSSGNEFVPEYNKVEGMQIAFCYQCRCSGSGMCPLVFSWVRLIEGTVSWFPGAVLFSLDNDITIKPVGMPLQSPGAEGIAWEISSGLYLSWSQAYSFLLSVYKDWEQMTCPGRPVLEKWGHRWELWNPAALLHFLLEPGKFTFSLE